MLVLSRRVGDSICISDDVVVRVTEIRGNQVRLAFEAPQSRRIVRGEIIDRAPAAADDLKSAVMNGKVLRPAM